MLHVSPVPGLRHQMAVMMLIVLLHAECPDTLHALPGPLAVRPSESTEVQPDFLVARVEDFTEELLPVAPLLAVEVLSPETELYDLTLKKAMYERIGVRSYWVVDPGEDPFDATLPYPVRIVPAELLDTLCERPRG
ncbi:Uma2 family endonuclease [Saccharothrix deserti]|uniref:Uma2 family endonuclease n=1 Tax=Saccharothrix deserti TaxID=2593674 RepID=UPI001EE404E2|nr:Uma2 family endonuclease [Saccharothrix deserti]